MGFNKEILAQNPTGNYILPLQSRGESFPNRKLQLSYS